MITAPGSIHVLHVDDEPAIADLTAECLEREDDRLAVETATSVSDGLDFLADGDYDCIVSDFDMPGQDGIDFLKAVRERHPNLPFILYTGKGTEEIASEAISAGVTDYLQKESSTGQYTVLANRIANSVAQARASQRIEHTRERQERYREALVELSMDEAVTTGDFETAVRRITETAADVLEVHRVNVWLAEDDAGETVLTCVDHYVRATGNHSDGMQLLTQEHPAYFEALQTHRAIDATDARDDPRTTELTDYLDANDIGAVLDATLRSEGESIGVLCHEHVGGPREWTDDQIAFASDVADIIHRALRNRKRNEREQSLRESSERLQAVLDTVEAAIFIKDTEERYQLMNQECRELLGIGPEADIVGRTDFDFFPDEVAAQIQMDDQRVLEKEETIELEEEIPTPEGVQINLTRKSPFYDHEGDLRGICAVSTPIES